MKKSIVTMSCVVLAACGPLEATEVEPLETVQQEARDRQGPDLVSASYEGASAFFPGFGAARDPKAPDGARIAALELRYGSLKASTATRTYEGSALVGTTFSGRMDRSSRALTFRILSVRPRPTSTTGEREFEYEISATDTATGATAPLCDARFGNRAVAVPDVWSASGVRAPSAGEFTFACTTGVVEKCIRWGYPYWKPDYQELHQACTRMARADYCGDGVSRTLLGTLVDLYDVRGVEGTPGFVSRTAGTPVLSFEAGWRSKGTAVCLSKLRWSTLPLGGYCPLTLPDPRVVPKTQNPAARFCEDFGDPATGLPFFRTLASAGAVVFNDSAYVDAGLFSWQHSSSRKYLSTTAGFYSTGPDVVSPASGFRTARFEGALYRVGLDPSLLPPETVPLTTYVNARTGSYLTTTRPPPADFRLFRKEGFIHTRPVRPSAPKLVLYRLRTGTEYLTTTRIPGPEWVVVRTEGYLPR